MRAAPLIVLCLLALGCGRGDPSAASEAGENAPVAPTPVAPAPAAEERSASGQDTASGESPGEARQPAPAAAGGQEDGFVVWESNRGGAWRLWRRELGAGEAKALTPAEPGRAHCCAHIAPDGTRLAYVSLPAEQAAYPTAGATGELRLLDLAAPGETVAPELGRPLTAEARTYFEHRAAVWRDESSLIHIDGDGRTVLRSVGQSPEGEPEVQILVEQPADAHGWLINPNLSFATRGAPTFSPFDRIGSRVDERQNLGGCQPYFSGDGRLGVWVAGAGGPIRAMDLESRRQWEIVRKSDPRLPADRRYLYFPMPSRDGRALAWAASANEHDHTSADYDVFVAETDASTLELIGAPRRITRAAATDRFPDVWLRPLELGRFAGEAPFRVELEAPGSGWTWNFGDGATDSAADEQGSSAQHIYRQAGRFVIEARRDESPKGEQFLRGLAVIRPAAPPELLDAETRAGGREVLLRFDEAIDPASGKVEIEGHDVRRRPGESADSLALALEPPLTRPAALRLSGVEDRAQSPNTMPQAEIRIRPPRWPARPEDLVFLWQSARHPNRVQDAQGQAHTTLLNPKGLAFTDRHGDMVLRGGAFQGDLGAMQRLLEGVRASNELTLELTLRADRPSTAQPATIFAFAAGSRRNLVLTQEGDRLMVRLATASHSRGAPPAIDVGRVTAGGVAQHLVVSYTPGHLRAFLDGVETAESRQSRSGFFHWRETYFRLGADGPPQGAGPEVLHRPWHGRLAGVAVYGRALTGEEARENGRRFAEGQARRDQVSQRTVEARLLERSRIPELEEITPYREALAVFAYETEDGERLHVVHRVLLDGRQTPIARLENGHRLELTLDPFADQPQLESLFLSNQLESEPPKMLYWSDRLAP